jgi:hypothetical protein
MVPGEMGDASTPIHGLKTHGRRRPYRLETGIDAEMVIDIILQKHNTQ